MMVVLVLYAYCVGFPSSPRIERACWEDAGAIISVSVRNGFAFLHRISWHPYNKAEVLIAQTKKYKQEYGCYPERIYADRIDLNTKI